MVLIGYVWRMYLPTNFSFYHVVGWYGVYAIHLVEHGESTFECTGYDGYRDVLCKDRWYDSYRYV